MTTSRAIAKPSPAPLMFVGRVAKFLKDLIQVFLNVIIINNDNINILKVMYVPESKINVLIHPVRLRIASLFGARGLTTKQISDALPDIPQGSLYRHIKKMVDVEIIQVAKERPVKGVLEREYRLNHKAALLNAQDINSTDSESLKNIYMTLILDLMREINECIDMPDYNIETHGPRFLKMYRYTDSHDRENMVKKLLGSVGETSGAEPTDGKNRTLVSFEILTVPE